VTKNINFLRIKFFENGDEKKISNPGISYFNPGISGLLYPNPGIPGLVPGLDLDYYHS